MNTLLKKYSPALFIALLSISFSSCEKEIDVDLKSVPPQLVIEGIVKQDQLATVYITHTLDFSNNNGYPNLSNAIVTISDDRGNSEVLEQGSNGWYTAKTIKGEIGYTYTMSVVYEDQEYTATSKMPPHVNLDDITMRKIPLIDYAIPVIHFKDPVGTENQYYRALVFINGKQNPDIQEQVESAEFTDGDDLARPLQIATNDEDNDPIKKGDELTIEFQCIDKGVYDFFFSLIYNATGQEATNPISNISNGALGYFSACTSQKKTITADWED